MKKKFLIDSLESLESQNVELRSELESVGTAAYLYGRSDLKAENAKLRELVRDMWPSYCYANSGCETFLTDEQDAAIRERVRRLKVINK